MFELLVIFLLILLNGVFSMSEIAMISARKTKLSSEAKKGKRGALTALRLQENPERFLSTIQIGITLIGILTGMYSGDKVAKDFASFLGGTGLSPAMASNVAKLIIVVAVTYLSIVVGELIPKKIGLNKGYKAAMAVAAPMYALSCIALPFVWLLEKSTSLLSSLLGVSEQENKVTEDEIKSVVQEGTEAGEVQEVEQDIIERVLVMGDQNIASIMTPRRDVTFLEKSMSREEVCQTITAKVCDSYPVKDEDGDSICGVASLADLVPALMRQEFSLDTLLQQPIFYPEMMTVYKALSNMKGQKISRALVCDEFGSMTGMISLKDILEGLVGTIQEHNAKPMIVERKGTDEWYVDGKCPFYDFLEHFDQDDLYDPDAYYNTVAGLVIDELGHIPTVGEVVEWHNFRIEVADLDGNRVDKLLVSLRNKTNG